MGTNVPAGDMPNQHVAHVLRVDLHDPDVRLFTSPRRENYVPGSAETDGYTVSGFLAKHGLQVAVNGGLFDPGTYYLPAGTPMDVAGFSVCEGTVVSTQTGPNDSAVMTFTRENVPTMIPTNWPPIDPAGIYTAVAGSYPVLIGGVNLGGRYRNDSDPIHRTNPRTVMGSSADGRWLFLVTIDGRQPSYSVGANDFESAAWLAWLGAWDGINLDGGGSTTMTIEDSLGKPQRLNRPSAVADSGRERTVGSHFGIFALPARGFINDVTVAADDISARVNWTTAAPALSRVRYGLTEDLGGLEVLETEAEDVATTEHSAQLRFLTPGTSYFFRILADQGGVAHATAARAFFTSNYVSAAVLLDVTHDWKYATANLDGMAWMSRDFDDAGWAGPGPGLLWVDGRGSPRTGVEPANTVLPLDASTGFPYPTYYFRTRFQYSGAGGPGVSLIATNYLDDGAVYYLNGVEVYRLRMRNAPGPILYSDLSIAYGCNGDATCPDVFRIEGEGATHLVSGENVLAVEVHNYNARSPDTTFGMSLTVLEPVVVRPELRIQRTATGALLSWDRPGFLLQSAAEPSGPWLDLEGAATGSPQGIPVTSTATYFRLRRL